MTMRKTTCQCRHFKKSKMSEIMIEKLMHVNGAKAVPAPEAPIIGVKISGVAIAVPVEEEVMIPIMTIIITTTRM